MPRQQVKIPSLLITTVMVGISSLEGTLFATAKPCPLCGGKPQPYDTKKKLYVILKTPTGRKKIMVNIRRFKCKKCGNLIYAEEPFYPDTRLGSAIVDMAISLARLHSYSHTAEIMKALGIEIDRGSVRNYALSNLPIPPANFFVRNAAAELIHLAHDKRDLRVERLGLFRRDPGIKRLSVSLQTAP